MVEEPTERSGFFRCEPVVDHNDVPTGEHHGPLKTKQTQLGWIRARGIRRHNCDVAIGRNIRDLGTAGIGTGPAHTVRVLTPSIDQDRVVIPGLLLDAVSRISGKLVTSSEEYKMVLRRMAVEATSGQVLLSVSPIVMLKSI